MESVVKQDAGLSLSHVVDACRAIARKFGIEELYLFGSVAAGTARPDSDVDLIYRADTDIFDYRARRAFRSELRDALGTDIDLVRKEYFSEPASDPYAELQRRAFVRDVESKPIILLL